MKIERKACILFFLSILIAGIYQNPVRAIDSDLPSVQAVAKLHGLTDEDAYRRLQAERKATRIYQGAQTLLADAYGGAWFDGEANSLVVATIDNIWNDPIRVMGARPHLVARSATELERAMVSFYQFSRKQRWHSNISTWYIDYRANQVIVEVEAEWLTQVQADLISHLADASIYRIEIADKRVAGASTPYRGAEEYRVAVTGGGCSAGFSVIHNLTAIEGFLSAGHCGNAGDSVLNNQWSALGTFARSSFSDPGTTMTDRAWISTDPIWSPVPEVTNHLGNYITVSGALSAPVGITVCRYGFASGPAGPYCGNIQSTNQSINIDFGVLGTHLITGLTRVNACIAAGDSGGPYLAAGGQAQGTAVGGELPLGCPSSHQSFFQPLIPTLTAFQLNLMEENTGNPPQITHFNCPNTSSSGNGMYYCDVSYQPQSDAQVQWSGFGGTGHGSGLFGTCNAHDWVDIHVTVSNNFGSDSRSALFQCPTNIIP